MITNISDRKDTKFLSYNNILSIEIKFHWQIIAFFLLYRWHSLINNVSLFTLEATMPEKMTLSKNAMPQSIYCTLVCYLWFKKVTNVKYSSFSQSLESRLSLFYRLVHKPLI